MVAKKALGRGLKALIPEVPRARSGLVEISIDRVKPNPNQPRHIFNEKALQELAASIREVGVLQPVLVSDDGDGSYIIIAGERRWRAAMAAGIERLPALVRERLEEEREFELALVENIQREDLSPLEESRAFDFLRASLGYSQAEIARRVGIDRSTVANALRLLRLEPEIQEMIDGGDLSGGHARALLAFNEGEERLAWAEKVRALGLSVRELERAASDKRTEDGGKKRRPAPEPDPNLKVAEDKLSLRLGARVAIRSRKRGGKIVIDCRDNDEMMRVFDLLMGDE